MCNCHGERHRLAGGRWVRRRVDGRRGGGLAQQRGDVVRTRIRCDDVNGPVSVEVRNCKGFRHIAGGERGQRPRDEGSAAIANQDADVVGQHVGRCDVELAVAIEVGQNDGGGSGIRGHRRPWREAARAVPKQNCYGVGRLVGDNQVLPAVAVEVSRRDGCWLDASGDIRSVHEHASPAGQKDRDRVRALIHDCQVRLAIAVEIGRGDRNWIGARTESRR